MKYAIKQVILNDVNSFMIVDTEKNEIFNFNSLANKHLVARLLNEHEQEKMRIEDIEFKIVRKRGRPKGSKNKKKEIK